MRKSSPVSISAPSRPNSFAKASMRSVSFILRFPIPSITVLPFANKAVTASVCTASGMLFILIVIPLNESP